MKGGEVIVMCEALGSQQLLLLGGIGPKDDLKKVAIPVMHDNQLVGTKYASSDTSVLPKGCNRGFLCLVLGIR
nr:protein HOTHEAD-like [Tanacetum cinerariifolium]